MPSPVPAPQIEFRPVHALKPYDRNARQHSRAQVRQIADSIRRFGFTNPVLVSDDGAIVAGHGRFMAAKELGMENVPTLRLPALLGAGASRGRMILAAQTGMVAGPSTRRTQGTSAAEAATPTCSKGGWKAGLIFGRQN